MKHVLGARDLITDQFVDLADELATAGVVPKTISELALVERNMATTLNTDMRRLFSLHCKISQDPTSFVTDSTTRLSISGTDN
jgi:hypothetical protein